MEKNKNLITIIVVLVVLIVLGFLAWWYVQQRGMALPTDQPIAPNENGDVPLPPLPPTEQVPTSPSTSSEGSNQQGQPINNDLPTTAPSAE
ncbi:MAG: hypothetical protein KatS3mg094_265 [Candidatus Parcubacteria bacterium]|nr:MAG: hypothetical protein KatS3mg094_265 [Candidatus Parcubacteria bacterium]